MNWNSLSIEERTKYEIFFTSIGLPPEQHMSYYYNELQNK